MIVVNDLGIGKLYQKEEPAFVAMVAGNTRDKK